MSRQWNVADCSVLTCKQTQNICVVDCSFYRLAISHVVGHSIGLPSTGLLVVMHAYAVFPLLYDE